MENLPKKLTCTFRSVCQVMVQKLSKLHHKRSDFQFRPSSRTAAFWHLYAHLLEKELHPITKSYRKWTSILEKQRKLTKFDGLIEVYRSWRREGSCCGSAWASRFIKSCRLREEDLSKLLYLHCVMNAKQHFYFKKLIQYFNTKFSSFNI